MAKEKSPKKGKSLKKKQPDSQHGSIVDLFQKQRQKILQQKHLGEKLQGDGSNVGESSTASDTANQVHNDSKEIQMQETASTSSYFSSHDCLDKIEETPSRSKLSKLSLRKKPVELQRSCGSETTGDHNKNNINVNTSSGLKRKIKSEDYGTDDVSGDSKDSKLRKQESENRINEPSVINPVSPKEPGVSTLACDSEILNNPDEIRSRTRTLKENGDGAKSEQRDESVEDITPTAVSRSDSAMVTEGEGDNSSDAFVQASTSASQSDVSDRKQDSQDDNMQSQEPETEEFKVPYYLENFQFILNAVINDEFYAYLFNEEDREVIARFTNLSENAQKLYVRLFGRIHRWLRKSKIVYPKIADDLTGVFCELVSSKLVMSESEMDDLEEVLKSLPAPDIKTVGKSLRLNTSQVREDIIAAIVKHTNQNNIGSFFSVGKSAAGGNSALRKSVLQRSKKLLGSCYKLRKEERVVFMRILMLFSVHHTRLEDNERDTGQQQIFQMLMSNIGRVKYPDYNIVRETKIFQNRDSLIRFTAALQVENDIHEALEKKEFDEALGIYNTAVGIANELHNSEEYLKHDKILPTFLRCYTAGAVYVRVLSYGVELLQFTKKYTEAVTQLESLINQNVYHLDYRGRWCERLALNLDFHLKKPSQALDMIKQSLNDENIRKGHRYALFQRAQKICGANSNKLKRRWEEFEADPMSAVQPAPEVFIQARKQEVPGGYPLFITEDSYTAENQNVTFMKRVEDVALNYYAKEGYPQGIHGEGGTFSFLFGLFLWDVIFMDAIPDVFYNLYQTHPLDFHSKHFYTARKESIDKRLSKIRQATLEELEQMLTESWEAHQDTLGLNWERFEDVSHAYGLLKCIGGHMLAAIFERFATDMRFTRSGVPDLTVWNPDTGKFKIVEVKGPGDRLSTKQILWLDYLVAIGVDAEVCYVKAIGAKKLQSSKQ